VSQIIKNMGRSVLIEASLNPQFFFGPVGKDEMLLLRHYDITGKLCPKPFVDDHRTWEEFVREVARLSA
jgi:hypothetical protein